MSSSKDETAKRNLPSWMNNKGESSGKKPTQESIESDQPPNPAKGRLSKRDLGASKKSDDFSKLLEGVVFVLSGLVNPERGTLRSQAMAMGAEYQPDWNSDCTLLVCAFPNTPKFRQVQADCGTIVSKEWISECYSQKKLVDIESYLMYAGKPWRRNNVSHEISTESKGSPPKGSQKGDGGSLSKLTASTVSKKKDSDPAKGKFSPSKVKKWAIDDLNNTISWLESQEEKPESDEIKKIAAEGILTCLQDAIDSLEQKQDVQKITEQWKFVPRVVEEIAKLEGMGENGAAISKENLYRKAMECKRVYEAEFDSVADDSLTKNKPKTGEENSVAGYDSDETIEMTEEEIDVAYNNVSSKLHER